MRRLAFSLIALAACAPPVDPLDFPGGGGGKTDGLGRGLAGIAAPYQPADLDEAVLVADMGARRRAAWETVAKIVDPVPLLGLAGGKGEAPVVDEGEIPEVARWQTWYGVDDLKRMFQRAYGRLSAADRAVRADFDRAAIDDAVDWNATAIERSTQWPLERYLAYVRSLGECPDAISDDDCARLVASRFGGAVSGNARILYSPAVAERVLASYRQILECLDTLDQLSVSAAPPSDDNFTACFDREVSRDGVLVKAQWVRADFGKTVPAFDTGGEALAARLAGTADWGSVGDRQRDPDPSEILTIRLRNGATYRLVGLHIMTKELRHWQWITLWWSDRPDRDFGADRPSLGGVWNNYKMCVVDGYVEGDANPAERFTKQRSLADALAAVDAGAGGPTWCSNPYLEHGRGNARTNCIGCHQHGGATVAFGAPLDLEAMLAGDLRSRVRDLFPADYLFSFNRVDDFAHVIAGEVGFHDASDATSVSSRISAIRARSGDPAAGAATFEARCLGCHASGPGPDLADRLPQRDDVFVLQTLILGRGPMPSWGALFDNQALADLLAHLREIT